jgi:ATP-dependent exoDNAse (exonuclease V) beta subunit
MSAPAPDAPARERAIHARGVNVVVEAGAGTGKTTLLVARLVQLVAPSDDGLPAAPLSRIAAITFTRKAAGELRLRIREALLRELACPELSGARRGRLAAALAGLDVAHVGTIHAFADRLLLGHPVEAALGPSHEILEDGAAVLREAFAAFLHAAEAGTLAEALAGGPAAAVAEAAGEAFRDALRAGIRPESRELEHGELAGLDRLFERLVERRDVPPRVAAVPPPDLAAFRKVVDAFDDLARASSGEGAGSRRVAELRRRLGELRGEEDPLALLRRLSRLPRGDLKKATDFPDDESGWKAWRLFDRGRVLTRPLHAWMARRLVAAAPAVVAFHDLVKARHGAVDQVDLLLRLRDLLRRRLDVRAELQARFDHVMVDEFQDTDPLQAEIVVLLCEAGARAATWREAQLDPGRLTIVGDPKQSIYRFRRADIGVYEDVRALALAGPHVLVRLETSFRAHPGLVAWMNPRFDALLGPPAAAGPEFDADAGTVANAHLLAARADHPEPRVVVIPLEVEDGLKPTYRAAEARALAAFLHGLVHGEGRVVVDPDTGAPRRAGYGDVAVLAASTLHLPALFPELDRLSIPYAARGGTLFLSDPLHRRFLLALHALADADDGAARAALLGPPFFAVGLEDLARARAAEPGSTHPGVVRARAALTLVSELRRRRHERSPGATARDLLERTAVAREVALGPNGAQRLEHLRELCLALDAVAAAEGLDYDAAAARLRAWAVAPVQLDPPRPSGEDAVQVLTTHQAKGLEFPIVILWDACQDLAARAERAAFVVRADGAAWSVALDGLAWEEPEGSGLAAREQRYLDAERRRLAYVAATRARDLLVVPLAGDPDPRWVNGALCAGAPEALQERLEPFGPGVEPGWAQVPTPAPRPRGDAARLFAATEAAWKAASAEAARPRHVPTSVTAEAHRADAGRLDDAGPRPLREGRFGSLFGETVHRAIGLALRLGLAPAAAVERAAVAAGLDAHRPEAAADVARALAALEAAGLRRRPGPELRLEYPLALAEEGRLVSGWADLVGVRGGRLAVVDFKTDAPPRGELAESHPAYVVQVRTYARILEALGLAPPGTVEAGLLFTAEEAIRWVGRG